MKYLISDREINTTSVSFATAKGTVIELTLVRNARLGDNGWLPSATHDMQLTINGNIASFRGTIDHDTHGYSLTANMGNTIIPVPAEHQSIIADMITEYDSNNIAAINHAQKSEDAYQAHHQRVIDAMHAD